MCSVEKILKEGETVDFLVDRKNIKWTSMMLTEHRVALKQLQQHVWDVAEPEKTEDELTEIAEVLGRAMNQGLMVKILYYRSKRYHQTKGKVVRWNQANQSIILDQEIAIPVRFIMKVELVDWNELES